MKAYITIVIFIVIVSYIFVACKSIDRSQENIDLQTDKGFVKDNTDQDFENSRKQSEIYLDNTSDCKDILENKEGIDYHFFDCVISGRKSKVHVLEIYVENKNVTLKPVLSFNMVFGYEKLSDMVEKQEAIAGVNGGFSYEYGRHGGVFIANNNYYNWKTGQYPVFLFRNDEYQIIESKDFRSYIQIAGKKMELHGINKPHEYTANMILYNRLYGNTDRITEEHYVVTVKNNIISEAGVRYGEQPIPENGYLITMGKPFDLLYLNELYKPGYDVQIIHQPFLNETDWAVECGDRLVKDGQNVAPEHSGWVGTLNGYDPRTAVGIKRNGNPVFVIVDGRQPGYSVGVTAKELADILINLDVIDAVMLDGGASSEMIFNGEIVSRPSYKGQERPMASAFIVVNSAY